MHIIPVINCENFECVKKRLEKVLEIGAEWVHFDVSDGKFAPVLSWNKPEKISNLKSQISKINIEVHLMVGDVEKYIEEWVNVGARRVIVHIETIKDLRFKIYDLRDVEIGLAVCLETPVEEVFPYLDEIRFVQFLAVSPGFSGQKFQEQILEKIRILRERDKNVTIEVDGGVNLEVAKRVREAGADIAVSGSYIFDAENSKEAYKQLLDAN